MDGDGNNKINLTQDQNVDGYNGYKIEDVSPDGQKLLLTQFVTDTTLWKSVYTTCIMNLDDHNIQYLNNSLFRPLDPKFSPDGLKIVFNGTENTHDIFIMNADGSNIKNLTNDQNWDGYPSFSADGRKIIFTSEINTLYDLFTIDSDGGNKRNLTNDGIISPPGYSVSNNGKIVYKSSKGISCVDINGFNQKKLIETPRCNKPKFSNNGKWISYILNKFYSIEIRIIDINGSNDRIVASSSLPPGYENWTPNVLFTPDNLNIIFTGYESDKEIYRISLSSGNLINLTNYSGEDELGLIVFKQ